LGQISIFLGQIFSVFSILSAYTLDCCPHKSCKRVVIENKFNAFKNYATEHSLHWGFIRDKGNPLYINNTEFAHDMADNHWVPLSQEF